MEKEEDGGGGGEWWRRRRWIVKKVVDGTEAWINASHSSIG